MIHLLSFRSYTIEVGKYGIDYRIMGIENTMMGIRDRIQDFSSYRPRLIAAAPRFAMTRKLKLWRRCR